MDGGAKTGRSLPNRETGYSSAGPENGSPLHDRDSRHDRKIGRHRGFISRIRHLRGHGIHSPFVYSLVRSVFTRGGNTDGDLYHTLREKGLTPKTSRRIERLCKFCGFDGYALGYRRNAQICIIPPDENFHTAMVCESPGTVFVIVEPYAGDQKIVDCLTIASKYGRLTIDSYRIFIIFDIERLPEQHFKI